MLAIAAGIVEGMNLGNNCMAALVSQGCSEIRWLCTKVIKFCFNLVLLINGCSWYRSNLCYHHLHFNFKMGAKTATLTGLSGSGDIMLTCFVNLSRNRTLGVRLGSGERLEDILSSMKQVD